MLRCTLLFVLSCAILSERTLVLGAQTVNAPLKEPSSLPPPAQNSRTDHCSFKPPQRPPVPEVKDRKWVRNALDAFVLTRLEKDGIQPSREADRIALIRRLSLDLTGLPPAPAEVEVFVNDQGEHAYELLVDRLLASAHFGEQWARHWLDLA